MPFFHVGGGQAPKPLDAITEKVVAILGEESVALKGIAGGIDILQDAL